MRKLIESVFDITGDDQDIKIFMDRSKFIEQYMNEDEISRYESSNWVLDSENVEGIFSHWNGRKMDLGGVRFSPDLNKKSVSPISVEDMFYDCPNLEELNLRDWDVSKTKNFEKMCCGCDSLRCVDFLEWVGRPKSTSCMFSRCKKLGEVNLPESFSLERVNDVSHMFFGCKNLRKVTLGDPNHPCKMKRLYSFCMFSGCSELEEIDLRGLVGDDIRDISSFSSNIASFGSMFARCSKLKKILGTLNLFVENYNPSKIFCGCNSLEDVKIHFLIEKQHNYYLKLALNDLISLNRNSIEFIAKNIDKIPTVPRTLRGAGCVIFYGPMLSKYGENFEKKICGLLNKKNWALAMCEKGNESYPKSTYSKFNFKNIP